jgi:hypothetical protein
MTKEELEKKLKISENTCIHCPTIEQAKQVLDIFHKTGLKWCTGKYYMICPNWDRNKENTVYHPFDGAYSSLEYAQLTGYKIISAEEFITLHTEEFNLENYVPKGELTGFPKEIIARMLECQEEQWNKRDVTVFEKNILAFLRVGGFYWEKTKEGYDFWYDVISNKNFNLFFEKYPKKEDNQEFRVGDKVIDIISGRRGKVTYIETLNKDSYSILVDFNNNEVVRFTLDGRYYSSDKHPSLLHYRDDYNYDVIDFNNLPKRQEANRWRAKVGEKYYYFNTYFEVDFFIEEYHNTDTKLYDLGDYFQTKEQAQEVADKLKEYFKQLVNKTR